MSERSKLEFPTGALDDFKPRRKDGVGEPRMPTTDVRRKVDANSHFPRREQVDDSVQINIRMTADIAQRFKQLCADDRRTYGAMIEILMDAFEAK